MRARTVTIGLLTALALGISSASLAVEPRERSPEVIAEIQPFSGDMAEFNRETNLLYFGWKSSTGVVVADASENKLLGILRFGVSVRKIVAWESAAKIVIWTGNSIEVLDARTHETSGRVPDRTDQWGLELNERDGLLYAVDFPPCPDQFCCDLFPADPCDDPDPWLPTYGTLELSVFDAHTMEHLGTTVLGVRVNQDTRIETVFDAATNRLFVADWNTGRLWQVDGATFEVVGETDLASNPTDLLVDPKLHKLYVASNTYGRTVTVDILDTGNLDPIASVSLRGRNARIALHEQTHRVFMTVGGFNATYDRMYVLDGWSNSVFSTVYGPTGGKPAVNQRTGRVYVGSGNGVAVIRAWPPGIVATVELPGTLFGFITVNPDSGLVYVSQRNVAEWKHSLAVIADPVSVAPD